MPEIPRQTWSYWMAFGTGGCFQHTKKRNNHRSKQRGANKHAESVQLSYSPNFWPTIFSSSEKTWGTSTMKTRHGYLSKRWYSAVHPKTTEDLVFLWALTHATVHGLPVLLLEVGNSSTNNVALSQRISGF